MRRVPTIAVDLDGPLHLYSQGWQDGVLYDIPTEGSLPALRRLMESYAVFVLTARDNLAAVAGWLMRHGDFEVVVDTGSTEFWNEQGKLLVTNRKLPAAVYVDDRAVRWFSWEQSLEAIFKYAPVSAGGV